MGSNKKLYGYYKTGKVWLPIKVSLGGSIIISEIPDHAEKHQDGGADEIVVTGLAGLLADNQNPLAHKVSHQDGGDDEIVVTSLAGLLADEQNPLDHHEDHEIGGSDEVSGLVHQHLIAQWDYVNGAIPTGWSLYEAGEYSIDKCVGGTATATCDAGDAVSPPKAFDDNEGTFWSTNVTCSVPDLYLRYDFGAGESHAITRVRMKNVDGWGMKTFKIQGSNNAIDWTDLKSCNGLDTTDWQNFDFDNTTAYRYIQMIASESWQGSGYIAEYEVEMMITEICLIKKD